MKSVIFILSLTLLSSSFAWDLKILSWYQINRQQMTDPAAEVCFSLSPKPASPVFAQITVDKNRRSEAYYSAWVGPKGSVCQVVTTLRGTVEVSIPKLVLSQKKQSFTQSINPE